MDNTVQIFNNLNKRSYFISPNLENAQSNQLKPKLVKHSDKKNDNLIVYSLGGLAVLGTVACIVKSKTSHSTKNEVEKADPLEITWLKHLIKEDYLAKRTPLVQKLNEEVAELGFKHKYKNIGELSAKIDKIETENKKKIQSLSNYKVKQSEVIKNKIAALSTDEEWQELRKLRKALIKSAKSNGGGEDRQVAAKKVVLVNELLLNKVYPEEIKPFRELYCMEPVAMKELIKQKFATVEDYNKAFINAQTIEEPHIIPVKRKGFVHMLPLRLRDLFPDEMAARKECDKEIVDLSFEFTELKNVLKEYHDAISVIAKETRNSENVKSLLAELAKNK